MLNLNRESTFDEIIKNKVVIFNLFSVTYSTKENKFSEIQLGKVLNDYFFNKDFSDFDKSRIIEVFSMKNLEKQNIVVLNNDTNSFSFNQTFYDLFSYLNEDKYYKLNNHSLKKFTNTMKSFRDDLEKINLNDKYESQQFIELLMDEFNDIRQELETHVRVLESKVNTLISLVEGKSDEKHLTNYELSKEIVGINRYFIEPLKLFIMSDSLIDVRSSGLGITGYSRKIRDRLEKEGYLLESKEITAFLLNFSKSYLARALSMSTKLTGYVRKSLEDIKAHANIERLYLFLEEKVEEVSHGKKFNKFLKSTDILDKINFLPDLKTRETSNNLIDYDSEIELIDIKIDNMNNTINEIEDKRDKIKTYIRDITEEDELLLKEEQFVAYGNGLLSDVKRELVTSSFEKGADIFRICHQKLKERMENYKLFYSVLLVYSMEDELKYTIDFSSKRYINYGGEQLVYFKKNIGEEYEQC